MPVILLPRQLEFLECFQNVERPRDYRILPRTEELQNASIIIQITATL